MDWIGLEARTNVREKRKLGSSIIELKLERYKNTKGMLDHRI